jgi:AraC family transcriptional regulator
MNSFQMQATARSRTLQAAPAPVVLFPTREGANVSRARAREAGEIAAFPAADRGSFDNVQFHTHPAAGRLTAVWSGFRGEIVSIGERERFESEYCGRFHLLIAYEGLVRQLGESLLDGAPPSKLRDLRQKLTFVPANRRFREWQEPRSPGRAIYLYIEADRLLVPPETSGAAGEIAPRLFFDSPELSQTVRKLTRLIEAGSSVCLEYGEALGIVLTHELLWLTRGKPSAEPPARGGLAGRQRRLVSDYLEQHLTEQVPLAKLVELTQLSPSHLSRAFTQSFGMPPHRFHTSRRIERAKSLLAEPGMSITDVALELGFSDASAFTVVFRKFTGRSPREYRRSLV